MRELACFSPTTVGRGEFFISFSRADTTYPTLVMSTGLKPISNALGPELFDEVAHVLGRPSRRVVLGGAGERVADQRLSDGQPLVTFGRGEDLRDPGA